MEWKYVKPLTSTSLIDDFEALTKYRFCQSFKDCVINNNGARPSNKAFDTDKTKERMLKSFLSFNKEDRETVWKIFEWCKEDLGDKFVPFAIDNFGNLICFDKSNDNVVFLDHEVASCELVADNFDNFLAKLYY